MNLIAAFTSWLVGRIGDAVLPNHRTMPPESLVAICVGHSRHINGKRDGGAVSVGGVSEWTFNRDIAFQIDRILREKGVASFVIDDYRGSGYTDSMRWLASEIKAKGATLAIECHFNAATGTAKGHEWLFWQNSKGGKALATAMRGAYEEAFPMSVNRGIKAKVSGERGGEFLKLTHCPAVIAEPFFGDNPQEWQVASSSVSAMAEAMATGICDYLTA
jgi:N-acetylmuramoyl-L-alanine amidase